MYLTNVSKDDIVMTSSVKMGKWGLDNSLYIGIVYASSKLQNATPKKSKVRRILRVLRRQSKWKYNNLLIYTFKFLFLFFFPISKPTAALYIFIYMTTHYNIEVLHYDQCMSQRVYW